MSEIATFVSRVTTWAQRRDDVQALVLVGSAARDQQPADEWSDVDLVVAAADPAVFLNTTEWLEPLSDVLVTTVESTAIGGATERRVLFSTGLDVDFSIVAAELLPLLSDFVQHPEVRALFGRGAKVLHDRIGIASLLATIDAPEAAPLQESEYRALSSAFWYEVVWAAKKLRRGELWVAKASADGPLLDRLIELMRQRSLALDPGVEVWHGRRFVERWALPDDAAELRACVTTYDSAGIAQSLRQLVAAFARVDSQVVAHLGYAPAAPTASLQQLANTILAPV